jgi:FixJ family two-component response regulator
MRFSTNLQSGAKAVTEADARVIVIDDDLELRASLGRLMRSVGLRSEQFASIAEFLESEPADCATCLILDVRLPGRSGLDFQQDLAAATVTPPIVFISGYGDIPMSVRAMKAGAIEFLTKPFRDQDLLDAVYVGLAKDRERRKNQAVMVSSSLRLISMDVSPCPPPLHINFQGIFRGGAPEQADCRSYRHHRNHSEGPSQ